MLRSLGLGLGLETFAKFFRVSVSVSEELVSEKSLGFGIFGLGKKVSVLVLENLVSEKKSRFWFRRIWSKKSISFCFGKLGLGKEKNQNNKKKTRPSKQCKFLI